MRRGVLSILIAGISVAALGVSSADAACNLNGTFKARQKDGYTVTFNFKLKGTKLTGTAKTKGMGGTAQLYGDVRDYPGARWEVYWPNGVVGQYHGFIDEVGRIDGRVWVYGDKHPQVPFHFLTRIPCD